MNFIELQTINEEKLRKFLEFFELSICKRCWASTYKDDTRPYHTHGGVLEILDGINTTKQVIQNWISDLEHGFFHGLMVLYFAYCLHPAKDILWDTVFQFNMRRPSLPRLKEGDKFIVSCILHDFMRFAYGNNKHDELLRNLTENLLEVTYRHSHPLPSDITDPLVGGDRLELMRYCDYKNWCDLEILNPYIEKYGGIELLEHFFKHIRPVLSRLFSGREDIWISHVLEINMNSMKPIIDNKGVSFFPKSHWKAEDNGFIINSHQDTEKYISVNMGKLPCGGCLSHTTTKFSARGMIALSDLRKKGNVIRCAPQSTAGRDHPFLVQENPINLEDWLFLYNDIKQINQFNTKNFRGLSEDIFNNIFRLAEDFINKFLVLSIKK